MTKINPSIYNINSRLQYYVLWVPYHIIYFHSVGPYRITKSIWIWK